MALVQRARWKETVCNRRHVLVRHWSISSRGLGIKREMIDRQTETGSIVVTPFPGAIETKPGSATVPFFGIEPAILDPTTGKVCPYETLEIQHRLFVPRNWKATAWKACWCSSILGLQSLGPCTMTTRGVWSRSVSPASLISYIICLDTLKHT